VIYERNISVEHRWNDTDRGKLKYWEKNLSQRHSVHHKSHMDWPRIEPGPPWKVAGDCSHARVERMYTEVKL
jgi:hypothetical protein